MTLDERVYADPSKFNPSRYLHKPEGNGEPHPNGPFGFGRRCISFVTFGEIVVLNASGLLFRLCPGLNIAEASLWIAMASILATLSISKALDENGKEITPEVKFISTITRWPGFHFLSLALELTIGQAILFRIDVAFKLGMSAPKHLFCKRISRMLINRLTSPNPFAFPCTYYVY
jgi:Cytochrome P450